MTKTGVVYRMTCIPTGKSYIGSTDDYRRRIRHHFSGLSALPALTSAIKTHGQENFIHEIICEAPLDLLEALEICYIHVCKTKAPSGYNLTDGGKGSRGRIVSEETRRKHGNTHRGKIISAETRQKMREAHKRRSPAQRKRQSEAQKGRPTWNKGIPLTPEHRAKMSASLKGKNKGKKRTPEQRARISAAAKKREKAKRSG